MCATEKKSSEQDTYNALRDTDDSRDIREREIICSGFIIIMKKKKKNNNNNNGVYHVYCRPI